MATILPSAGNSGGVRVLLEEPFLFKKLKAIYKMPYAYGISEMKVRSVGLV
jgi:hypothetical protein